MTETLKMGGVDMSGYGQHAVRAANAAFLSREKQLSVSQICQKADWYQTSGVYQKFYRRFVAK